MVEHQLAEIAFVQVGMHVCVCVRGVPIIGSADISATDMLIFTVSVISTVNQGKQIQVPI